VGEKVGGARISETVILLDTQILLWFTEGDTRLSEQARVHVGEEWKAERAAISAMSLWEIGMLLEKRRISISLPLPDYVQRVVDGAKLKVVPIDRSIAFESSQLPAGLPGDPDDRLIAATARTLNRPLLTADRQILAYAAAGHLQAIDARR